MWISIAVSGAFIAIYGSRIAEEARQLTSALTATELTLARQQHLSQLDGIAAAAAHELGTPLATVALVVHDLAAQPQIAAQWADDLRLAEEQVARCRTILRKLSSPDTIAAASLEETTLGDLIEEIVAPHRLLDVAIEVESQGTPPEPICRRNAGLIYGLHNIVENAVSFAERRVQISASWTASEVQDRHRRRRPRLPAPSARAARRTLYFHPRRRGAAARGRGGRRPWPRPVHRQGAARKIRRRAGDRQSAGAGVRRGGDDRLADRKVRTGSTTASTGVRKLGLWPTVTRPPNPKGTPSSPPAAEPTALEKSLLIVDDDRPFGERLARAMGSRGFTPRVAISVAEGLAAIQAEAPAFAVIDLKLGDGTGLDVMKALKAKRPEAKAIILTGYGAIATAVVAVKLGAYDYLAKPVNADEIVAVLTAERGQHVDGPEHPMSADRVRWEHIQRVYESCERNVSETARQLNMHRRTLQRILGKRAPR